MGNESHKLALISAASIICLLLVTYDNTGKREFPTWRYRNGGLEEEKDEPVQFLLRRLVRGEERIRLETIGFSCHYDIHTEACFTSKQVRVNNSALKVYVSGSPEGFQQNIMPYALRDDRTAMERVTPIPVIHGDVTNLPSCNHSHDAPAVIFSSGGFTGNIFHEINEIIIPLYLTTHHFRGHVQFVITDFKPWWVRKYSKILSKLSRYDVVNPLADQSVHCFNGAVIGLKYHDYLAINYTEIPGGYTIFDFRYFLRQSYGLRFSNVSEIEKPTLVLLSRAHSRMFLNEKEMVGMMEDIGFQVILATANRMSNLDKFVEVINSCSVLVGTHGAGLTNEVFLPDRAVMIQVVPLGLDWAASSYYGDPAIKMGLKYLEYKIEPEESSLLEQYGPDHPAIKDPKSILLQGYRVARAMYLDSQNLKINITRFRGMLLEALNLIENNQQ